MQSCSAREFKSLICVQYFFFRDGGHSLYVLRVLFLSPWLTDISFVKHANLFKIVKSNGWKLRSIRNFRDLFKQRKKTWIHYESINANQPLSLYKCTAKMHVSVAIQAKLHHFIKFNYIVINITHKNENISVYYAKRKQK